VGVSYVLGVLTKPAACHNVGQVCVYPFGNWDLGGPGV
jgi:hypothetical protein